jgi:PIN domain nuclease of toxin-antitoxin system
VGRRAVIVLDTHAWIWWRADPARLSAPGARAIAEADRIGVSSISVWELGMLVRRGRISLDRNVARWVRQALSDARIAVLAPGPDVALAAALLDDGFPGDPADRLIYAAARQAGARLVTRDSRIARFDPARVAW